MSGACEMSWRCRLEIGDTADWKSALRKIERLALRRQLLEFDIWSFPEA